MTVPRTVQKPVWQHVLGFNHSIWIKDTKLFMWHACYSKAVLETFFCKSWKICVQTYQVNKMKLHACLPLLPSSSALLESECHHQVGVIKSLHALSAFILNSSEDLLTNFVCIFWQYFYSWTFMTVFRVCCNSWIICSL